MASGAQNLRANSSGQSMDIRHYDTIVIGSGPGGEGAAMRLSKAGQQLAVVERYRDVGGACTHWGTIPSKALRHGVQQLADYQADALFRRLVGPVDFTYPDLLASAETMIRRQARGKEGNFHRNRIDILTGTARFVDSHTIEVSADGGPAPKAWTSATPGYTTAKPSCARA